MKNSWIKTELGEHIETLKGFAFKSKWYQKTGVAVVRVSDFTENSISTQALNYISDEIANSYCRYKIHHHDVIVQTVGSWQSNPASVVGKVIHVPYNMEGALLNQNPVKIIPKASITQRFLYYLLKANNFRQHNLNYAQGAANQASITLDTIKRFKLNLPPLPTQQKIADILSAYDDLIENNTKRIELLEEQAQLIYEEWFVRMRFPNHENTKIDVEIGLPEGWEIVTVNSLLAKAKSTKKIKKSEILDEGTIPVIDQSRDFISGFTDDIDALVETEGPIIVFGDHTRVLKLVNFDFARGADGTQLIISNSARMPQHLFYHVLQALDLSNYHYARHFKYLKSEEVVLPDVSTASSFESFVSLHYQLIQKLRLQNQKLKEARDILLPRLMMGIIEV